jgi:hypothetical protein
MEPPAHLRRFDAADWPPEDGDRLTNGATLAASTCGQMVGGLMMSWTSCESAGM